MSSYVPRELVQESYLNNLRKTNAPVTIYLTNGVRLDGTIVSFDVHTILLRGEETQIIYKHYIATIARQRQAADRQPRPRAPARDRAPTVIERRRAPRLPRTPVTADN